MPDLTIACPQCGDQAVLGWPLRRAAEEFCGRCDYPLFWAPELAEMHGDGVDVGHQPAGPDRSIDCERCAHANVTNARYCNQCGGPLVATEEPLGR